MRIYRTQSVQTAIVIINREEEAVHFCLMTLKLLPGCLEDPEDLELVDFLKPFPTQEQILVRLSII